MDRELRQISENKTSPKSIWSMTASVCLTLFLLISADRYFKQIVGILMGNDYAPLLADLCFIPTFIQKLFKDMQFQIHRRNLVIELWWVWLLCPHDLSTNLISNARKIISVLPYIWLIISQSSTWLIISGYITVCRILMALCLKQKHGTQRQASKKRH